MHPSALVSFCDDVLLSVTFTTSTNLAFQVTRLPFATAAVFSPQSGAELQAAIDACIEPSQGGIVTGNCTDGPSEPIPLCGRPSGACLQPELPPQVQQQIREKQLAAKARKQKLKSQKAKTTTSSSTESYPSSITMEQYCSACPGGGFQHPMLAAHEHNVDILLSLEASNTAIAVCQGRNLTLAEFNYFIFGGTDAQAWSPRFYAKLAFEGFFTTTSKHRGPSVIMLPELQPFYRSVCCVWADTILVMHVTELCSVCVPIGILSCSHAWMGDI